MTDEPAFASAASINLLEISTADHAEELGTSLRCPGASSGEDVRHGHVETGGNIDVADLRAGAQRPSAQLPGQRGRGKTGGRLPPQAPVDLRRANARRQTPSVRSRRSERKNGW